MSSSVNNTTEYHRVLAGNNYDLLPLTQEYFSQLESIVLSDPEVYRYTTLGASKQSFQQWFDTALCDGAWVVQRCADGAIVGSTRLYQINPRVASLAIGFTWYRPDLRGSGVNTEVKRILLEYVFTCLAMQRVQFEINADNVASRKAVEKLGAVLEGRLRNHRKTAQGELADTCIYGLLKDEWSDSAIAAITRGKI